MLRVRTAITGIQGAPYLSTMYFGTADSQTGADNANAAVAAFWTTIKARWPATVSFTTDGLVSQLTAAGVLTATYNVTSTTGAGTATASLGPHAVQGLIRWSTGVFTGGREIRGRTFIPAVQTMDQTTAGLPIAAYLTVLNTAATNLRASGAGLSIWSRKNGTNNLVSGGQAWTDFASLRSRRDA